MNHRMSPKHMDHCEQASRAEKPPMPIADHTLTGPLYYEPERPLARCMVGAIIGYSDDWDVQLELARMLFAHGRPIRHRSKGGDYSVRVTARAAYLVKVRAWAEITYGTRPGNHVRAEVLAAYVAATGDAWQEPEDPTSACDSTEGQQ